LLQNDWYVFIQNVSTLLIQLDQKDKQSDTDVSTKHVMDLGLIWATSERRVFW